jgi:uncharacterized membrane protein YjdF
MRKEMKLPTIITYVYLLIILIINIIQGNMEFLGYAIVIGLLYLLLLRFDKTYKFPPLYIWLFVIWIILHFLGGNLIINGTKLYDYILLPLFNGGGELVLLKYDQVMHFYTYIVIGMLCYHALKKHTKKETTKKTVAIFAALAAMGIGGINEVLEFGMVLFANAAAAVGGYTNTALDICFNTIGAIVGVWIARKKQ